MKLIRNISKAEIQFFGGNLLPEEEKSFPDSIANRVLRHNPTRIILVEECKETAEVTEEISEAVETVEAVEVTEEVKPVKPASKSRKKRK